MNYKGAMPRKCEVVKQENKCSDCLYMELRITPLPEGRRRLPGLFNRPREDFNTLSEEINKAKLTFNILFNEQWESIPAGRVKFGISRGELSLELENCEVPVASRALCGDLELSVEKNRQQTNKEHSSVAVQGSISQNSMALNTKYSQENSTETTDSFHFIACQVTTKDSPKSPAWVFEVKIGEPVLKGRLSEDELGMLEGTGRLIWSVKARFEVSLRDVKITDSEGIWLQDFVPENRAVLDRAIAKQLLKYKLKPYLSRVELRYV